MRYGAIKYCDIANGEGVRTSLFVSGCTHCCPGCFQPETWSFDYGEEYTPEVEQQVLDSLRQPFVHGLTLLGGEPMEPQNQRALVGLVERVHRELPGKSVWCYTGDAYEELAAPGGERRTEVTERLLAGIDVLVDGLYEEELADITLRFRGSSNQRVIDMAATRAAGHVVLWQDDPLFASHEM